MPHIKTFTGEHVDVQLVDWMIENPTYDYKILVSCEDFIKIVYKGAY